MNVTVLSEEDIELIKSGAKTSICRAFKMPDGEYNIGEGVVVKAKGYHYRNISDMPNPEAWAKVEGYKDLKDLSKHLKIGYVKDFLKGKRSIYIYRLTLNPY